MAAPEVLTAFVRDALARGLPRSQVERALLGAGWEPDQVAAGLRSFADIDFPVPVPRPAPNLSAREAFIYLLLFTTLYLSAYNLGLILVRCIDLAIPDPAAVDYFAGRASILVSLRWAISSLIVAFPAFLYLSVLTTREVRRDPARRASRVRRWLTYLTLFVAAAIILGDLIALLNDVLGGELTLRFLLKALITGAIAAAIFTYYLSDLRREEAGATP